MLRAQRIAGPVPPADGARTRRRLVPLVVLGLLALGPVRTGAEAPPPEVRLRVSSAEVAAALESNGWIRWLARSRGLGVSVEGPGAPAGAEGIVVDVRVGSSLPGLLDGHPVRVAADGLRVGSRLHQDSGLAVATRAPAADSAAWVVVGPERSTVERATARLLVRLAGGEQWDVLVLSPEQLEHRALFLAQPGGFRVDPKTEVDQLAQRDAHYRNLEELRLDGIRVRGAKEVLADPVLAGRLAKLPSRLRAWSERVPVALGAPLEVILEADHESLGRHRGLLGPSVDPDGRLHWVPGPDLWQLEWGVARALVDRAGLAPDRPWLADGAALRLSGHWWGQPLEAWGEPLADAGLMPSAAELAEVERSADASTIFRPAAAALLLGGVDAPDLRSAVERLAAPGAIERRLRAWRSRTAERGVATTPSGGEPRPGLPFLRGVSLAMANGLEIGYHSRALDPRLERLRTLGSNAVSIMPFAYQPRPDRPELRFLNRRPSSETDAGAIHAARRARDAGFVVLWKPHVWVSHDSWPGEIEMTDEAAWRVWWRLYRRYVLHHAVLAREAGAEILSLGVELGRTTGHAGEWTELARDARTLFPGLLTYAGNWHDDYDRFPAWEELDLVGVDAYFPLGEPGAGREELVAGARRLAARLAADADRLRRPVLLTEVGFAARRHAWVEPHREGGEPSTEDQALAWRALLDGLGRPGWLAGLFAWKVFSADLGEPGEAPDFRILDRPAEAELGRYFRAASER